MADKEEMRTAKGTVPNPKYYEPKGGDEARFFKKHVVKLVDKIRNDQPNRPKGVNGGGEVFDTPPKVKKDETVKAHPDTEGGEDEYVYEDLNDPHSYDTMVADYKKWKKGSDSEKNSIEDKHGTKAVHYFNKAAKAHDSDDEENHLDMAYEHSHNSAHNLGESAPPGMEKTVLALKKKFPGHPEKAFKIAWSMYKKNEAYLGEAGEPMSAAPATSDSPSMGGNQAPTSSSNFKNDMSQKGNDQDADANVSPIRKELEALALTAAQLYEIMDDQVNDQETSTKISDALIAIQEIYDAAAQSTNNTSTDKKPTDDNTSGRPDATSQGAQPSMAKEDVTPSRRQRTGDYAARISGTQTSGQADAALRTARADAITAQSNRNQIQALKKNISASYEPEGEQIDEDVDHMQGLMKQKAIIQQHDDAMSALENKHGSKAAAKLPAFQDHMEKHNAAIDQHNVHHDALRAAGKIDKNGNFTENASYEGEQIDELNDRTIELYMKGARNSQGRAQNVLQNPNSSDSGKEQAAKTYYKRARGLASARWRVDPLSQYSSGPSWGPRDLRSRTAKEEVEHLDETSKRRIGDYLEGRAKSEMGRISAASFESGARGDTHNKAPYDDRQSRNAEQGQRTAIAKLTGKARVNATEEVEQIDELKASTYRSFAKQAPKKAKELEADAARKERYASTLMGKGAAPIKLMPGSRDDTEADKERAGDLMASARQTQKRADNFNRAAKVAKKKSVEVDGGINPTDEPDALTNLRKDTFKKNILANRKGK